MNCLHVAFSSKYHRLGSFIAQHPIWFIIVPLIISISMFTAVYKLSFIRDMDSVFASPNGNAMRQKRIVESLYPVNTSYNFEITKFTERGRFGSVIILAKDGRNLLRSDIYSSVMEVDRTIRNFTIEGALNYSQLCARKGDECQKNHIFNILNTTSIKFFEEGRLGIKYPIIIDYRTGQYKETISNFGGVTTNEDGNVIEAKTIRLLYFLDSSDEHKKKITDLWETRFLEIVSKLRLYGINIYMLVGKSFSEEIAKVSVAALPMGIVTTGMTFVFCILVSMTNKVVKCKPLFGIFGATSALIGVGTAFGFLIYCGFECVDLNAAIPFLMLGIGVDDTFVLLAAWRRTNSNDDVPKRMSETYSEAAVSITITSLTNFLSFVIGIFNPFPFIHIFCMYAAAAVFFTYLYQITFFGGWMAISGYREKKKLNPFTFRPVESPPNNTRNTGTLCKNSKDNDIMEWISQTLFANKIGNSISSKKGKIIVMSIYSIYLCVSIWGCTQVKDGLEYDTIFTDNSYAAKYLNVHLKYMTAYTHRIHLVITETLDYSDLAVQSEIEKTLSVIESNPYVSNLTTSWLRAFLRMSKDSRFSYSFNPFNLTKKEEFIQAVAVFLKLPWGNTFNGDIVFSDDGTDFLSSRFILTSQNVSSSKLEGALFEELNKIISGCNIKMAVHETWFPFYEQVLLVPKNSIVAIAVAAATMTVVFFIFIPNFIYAACVTCTIVSIQVGAIGFMTFWNVNRDVVSAMCLLMSVGFSVDYATHMINGYVTSRKTSPNERLQDTLGTTGVAVCQGSISTLLGLVFLSLVPAELLRMFFKILFLVVSFAVLHSVFLLPVLLTVVDNIGLKICCMSRDPAQRTDDDKCKGDKYKYVCNSEEIEV